MLWYNQDIHIKYVLDFFSALYWFPTDSVPLPRTPALVSRRLSVALSSLLGALWCPFLFKALPSHPRSLLEGFSRGCPGSQADQGRLLQLLCPVLPTVSDLASAHSCGLRDGPMGPSHSHEGGHPWLTIVDWVCFMPHRGGGSMLTTGLGQWAELSQCPSRNAGKCGRSFNLHLEPWPLPACEDLGPSLCPHRWEPPPYDPLDDPGQWAPLSLVASSLVWFPLHLGNFLFFCMCLWVRVSEIFKIALLSVRSRGGLLGRHHNHPLCRGVWAQDPFMSHPLLLSAALEINNGDPAMNLTPLSSQPLWGVRLATTCPGGNSGSERALPSRSQEQWGQISIEMFSFKLRPLTQIKVP